MSIGSIRLTKADHGRRMSWDEYAQADSDDALIAELGRGVFSVIDVPEFRDGLRTNRVSSQFFRFWDAHQQQIQLIATGSECRLPMPELESDRHPDLAVYTTPPPQGVSADEFWSTWIPAIVVEVVSLSSAVRDYDEKPDEYLQFGVREYWIIDPHKNEMLVLRRSGGRWRRITVRPGESYRTPVLRDFEFHLAEFLASETAD